MVVDFETTGDFPKYGNDDERADEIAVWLLETFMRKLEKVSYLPRFRGYHIHSDHYFKRRIRKSNRSNAGWKKSMDTIVTGSKPILWRRDRTDC